MTKAQRICSIDGCEKPAKKGGRGWCGMHYMRWWKHGDPFARKMIFGSVADRLDRYVDKRGPDECWPWTGALRRGYGAIRSDRTTSAHIAAYEYWVGLVPEGMTLDHMCHDPESCTPGESCPHRRCCNPSHLRIATSRDNTLRGGGLTAINAQKTHCPKGHPYNEANTMLRIRKRANGATYQARQCRTCAKEQGRARKERAREARRAA